MGVCPGRSLPISGTCATSASSAQRARSRGGRMPGHARSTPIPATSVARGSRRRRPSWRAQWGTWTVTYEVGAYGYDERARLKIAWRFASDWGTPQFTDPTGANYTTVRLETKCETAVATIAFEPRGQVRPVVQDAWPSRSPTARCIRAIASTSRSATPAAAARARARRRSASAAASGACSSIRSAPSSTRRSPASPALDVVGGALPSPRRRGADHRAAGRAVRRAGEGGGPLGQPVRALHRHRGAARRPDWRGCRRRCASRAARWRWRALPGLRLRAAGAETRIVAVHGEHRAPSNLIRALRAGRGEDASGATSTARRARPSAPARSRSTSPSAATSRCST